MTTKPIVKVCGMREAQNIKEVLALNPDFIGFIFYEKSRRYLPVLPRDLDFKTTRTVGVFVDASIEEVVRTTKQNALDFVQLHGKESAEYCTVLKIAGIQIIKAFSIDADFDFKITKEYSSACKYFLFDTKGLLPGGNGQKFDWNLLDNYKGNTPFLLSGGIDPNHTQEILSLNHSMLAGIDVNSGFETAPALKNIEHLKQFIYDLRN